MPSVRSAPTAPLHGVAHQPTRTRPLRLRVSHLAGQSQVQPHRHAWAQVATSATGVLRMTAGHGTYLVPPSRALWIPPGVEHAVTAEEDAEIRTLYIHPAARFLRDPAAPPSPFAAWTGCRVIEVSPLLRQLIGHLDPAPGDTAADEREQRLCDLVLDELRRAAPVRLGVALPADKRLRALCQAVLADPQRHATLDGWATDVGASPRTLARLFRLQLGTTFGQWRQQAQLARALSLAAERRPIGQIASELGFASASAFSAMVRRAVGTTPRQFLAGR